MDAKVDCSRCGHLANPNDRWENDWPNYGYITLGLDCCGQDEIPTGFGLNPAMKTGRLESAQEVVLEWGTGYRFDSTGRYRLCRRCQRELWRMVGLFFQPTASK